ncbi:MAG: DMT family transporter [Anaerolineae bacterium]
MGAVSHLVMGRRRGRLHLEMADGGMLFVVLVWGANYPLMKFALAHLDPVVFNAMRMAVAVLVLPVLALLLRTNLRVSRGDLGKLFVLGMLGYTGYQLLFIHGIAQTTASNASLVLSTSPVWVALLGALLGVERVGQLGWLGMFSSVTGIALLVTGKGDSLHLGTSTVVGDLLILSGCVTWAFYTLGCKPLIHRYGSMPVTIYSLLLGVWPLILLALPRVPTQPWGQMGWEVYGVAVFSGLFAIAAGYVIWNLGIGRLGPTRTAVYVLVSPVVSAMIGWLWLGERFGSLQWVGAALTLAGVILTRLSKSLAKEKPGGETGD